MGLHRHGSRAPVWSPLCVRGCGHRGHHLFTDWSCRLWPGHGRLCADPVVPVPLTVRAQVHYHHSTIQNPRGFDVRSKGSKTVRLGDNEDSQKKVIFTTVSQLQQFDPGPV